MSETATRSGIRTTSVTEAQVRRELLDWDDGCPRLVAGVLVPGLANLYIHAGDRGCEQPIRRTRLITAMVAPCAATPTCTTASVPPPLARERNSTSPMPAPTPNSAMRTPNCASLA